MPLKLTHLHLIKSPTAAHGSSTEDVTEDWTPKYPQVPAVHGAIEEQSIADDGDITASLPFTKLHHLTSRNVEMSQQLNQILEELSTINGFIAASIADAESGMSLATKSSANGFDIEVAAAANAEVVRAKSAAVQALRLDSEKIEDFLITLSNQYHLIRLSSKNPMIFIYLALDRKKANLALARHTLNNVESQLNI